MKVAIVGTSKTLSENEDRDMRQLIAMTLKDYSTNNTIIISGGAKGVDEIAIGIAKTLNFETEIFKPLKPEKEYYRKRNQLIAENCDVLHCFSIPVRTKKCYHHDPPQDHERTGGCWTYKMARELGKSCHLLVTPDRKCL